MRAKISGFPKIIVQVVYKSERGYWRGFCSPYDVTCEAQTKISAKRQLEKLVDLYDEGLKKYAYPRHLAVKPLSDSEDNKVFKMAVKIVSADMKQKLEKEYIKFQQERKREEFTISKPSSSGYYYQPVFAS